MYILDMRFEWDENKRLYNIEKHGLDFQDADAVFKDSHHSSQLKNIVKLSSNNLHY